jgi:diguanylate cyclase (GGDEF)-like protein
VLRPQDTVARLSGDEFVVLCEGLHAALTAQEIGERLVTALMAPTPIGDRHLALGASIGATVSACARDEPETLLRQADSAMYRAKGAAGDEVRLRFFDATTGQPEKPRSLPGDLA